MALMWVPWEEEKPVHQGQLITATSGPNLIKRVSYFKTPHIRTISATD